MPSTWLQSLLAYQYPFDLSRFEDAKQYPDWFALRAGTGDRASTIAFEAYFREHAAAALEPWLEVVYWKLYNQPPTRGEKITRQVAAHFKRQQISPQTLWSACNHYVNNPTRQSFDAFRRLLGFKSPVIAVAFTFPVFLEPQQYPMVDTRIAKWVGQCMFLHNAADPSGPQLKRPRYLDTKQTVLTLSDFDFAESWITWCRYQAQKLSSCTPLEWRARDVEMAVFQAWGGRHDRHPKDHLHPLDRNRLFRPN